MLNLVDEFTRECLAIRIDRRLRSTDIIDVDLSRFRSGQVLMLGSPLFEGHG